MRKDGDLLKNTKIIPIENVKDYYKLQLVYILNNDIKLRKALGTRKDKLITLEEFNNHNKEWAKSRNANIFAIIIDNTIAIGTISLSHQNMSQFTGKIGYWISSEYWRKGYTSNAFLQVLRYACNKGIKNVSATIKTDNLASKRIWEKNGASFELLNDKFKASINLGGNMKKIILIQHCQSEHHLKDNNMSGGWTDTRLTELGRNQAHLIGKRLKEVISKDEYVLYTSDLKRAKETAEIIDSYLNLGIIEEPRLREINTGIAAGKTKEWVKENRIPMPEGSFKIDHRSFKGGETWRELFIRVNNCMEELYNSNKKNLIIVTHGCALAYIIGGWLGFTPEMYENSLICASPASISILEVSRYNQRTLSKLNDTSHLMKL